MDGSGIAEASAWVYHTQFPRSSAFAGLVYTPPKFSDHIAVCCPMKASSVSEMSPTRSNCLPEALWMEVARRAVENCGSFSTLDVGCPKTQRSQPHRGWRGIQTFFNMASKIRTSDKPERPQIESGKIIDCDAQCEKSEKSVDVREGAWNSKRSVSEIRGQLIATSAVPLPVSGSKKPRQSKPTKGVDRSKTNSAQRDMRDFLGNLKK